MELTIFHHHLKKGGVTDTVYNSVISFLDSPHSEKAHINIVCGEEIPQAHPLSALVHNNEFFSLYIEPAVGYITDIGKSVDVEKSLLSCFAQFQNKDAVWWVHNHHLGKNPIFTRMLMEFLTNSLQPCILEIHDFPEAARFSNMAFLEQEMPLSLAYSNTPHSIFATINSYNNRTLQEAGLESKWLPNVIPAYKPPPADDTPRTIKKDIVSFFPQYAGNVQDEDYLLFTYPVRCIRRKNVLEAALITKLYELQFKTKSLFCITLAGVSASEKHYSDTVHEQFERGHIRGFFDIGNSLDTHNINFQLITRSSNLIISSSTQEGFGFSYIGSTHWLTPLLARNVFVSEDIAPALNPHWLNHWYDTLAIPLELLEWHITHAKSTIHNYYTQKLSSLHAHYHHSLLDHLRQKLEAMLDKSDIDFSFLPIDMQIQIIQWDNDVLLQLCKHNTSLLTHTHKLITWKQHTTLDEKIERQQKTITKVEQQFGKKKFLERFYDCCNIVLQGKSKVPQNPEEASMYIKKEFLNLENIRALYDDW